MKQPMSKKKVPVSAATSTPSLDNDTLARIAAALERLLAQALTGSPANPAAARTP